MLIAKDVAKSYPTPRGALSILSGISLTLERGDAVAIMGPSGSGKSTLLYILGALEPPSSGTVTLDGAGSVHARRARAGGVPQPARRLRVPGSFAAAAVLGARERADADARGAAAAEGNAAEDERRAREILGAGRPAGSPRSSPRRAVGRREAACRRRARADPQPRACCCATSRPATSIAASADAVADPAARSAQGAADDPRRRHAQPRAGGAVPRALRDGWRTARGDDFHPPRPSQRHVSLAHESRRRRSASRRRCRCSRARCSSATRCAAACATSRSDASDAPSSVVSSTGFFREALADDLRAAGAGTATAPLVVASGFVTHEAIGPPRGGRARLRRRRTVLAVPRPAASRRRRHLAGARGGARRDRAATCCSSGCRSRPRFRSSRCSDARTTSAGRCGWMSPACCRASGSASSRCGRSSRKCARCSRRCGRIQRDLAIAGKVNTVLLAGGDEAASTPRRAPR